MKKDSSLFDRPVIITGGARGLGREMALCLAKLGARICITATTKGEAFERTSNELTQILGANRFLSSIVNVSNTEGMQKLVSECVEKFSRVDVLVNNAGRGMRLISESFNSIPTKFWESDPEAWSKIVDVNINGPFVATRAVVPQMIKQKFGKIINISTSSQTMVRKGYSPYGPSKAFLEAASRCWSQDLTGLGVDVNVLLPGGAADTDLLPPSDNKKGADGNLLPSSIMNEAITWLVSDQSNGISGGRFIGRYWDSLSSRRDDLGKNPQLM